MELISKSEVVEHCRAKWGNVDHIKMRGIVRDNWKDGSGRLDCVRMVRAWLLGTTGVESFDAAIAFIKSVNVN